MGVFNGGMDLWCGYSGVVIDKVAGTALIRRAAEAGLRSARAWCHYYIKHESAKAFPLLQAEVEGSASETEASGGPCVHAAFNLGWCYHHGYGVEEDEARALELYHHAVEVDENQQAMHWLAKVYQYGQLGQARDYERALSLYKRGAESGGYECRRYLGVHIYAKGRCGVEVDLKQALYWLEKCNEQSGGTQGGTHAGEIETIRERMRNSAGQE